MIRYEQKVGPSSLGLTNPLEVAPLGWAVADTPRPPRSGEASPCCGFLLWEGLTGTETPLEVCLPRGSQLIEEDNPWTPHHELKLITHIFHSQVEWDEDPQRLQVTGKL